jgi:integrase
MMRLTTKRIARLTAPGRYSDGFGLYLQIQSATSRSWLFRYQRHGRERWLGLGACHTIDLREARERARKARHLLVDGIDPIEARKAERVALALAEARTLTFEAATRQYFDQHEKKWRRAKHRAQFLSSLMSYAFPKIGSLSVDDIDTGQVLRVIEPIWVRIPESANRLRSRIEAVLDWATVRGYRTGDNPARWRAHLDNVLPSRGSIQKTVHHAALPYPELPEFMAALKLRAGTAARCLEFTILTAARTGEALKATWGEIDLKGKVWTIPAGRMKGGREHRAPLPAIEIIGALPREDDNEFVFIGPRAQGLSNMAMAKVLTRMGQVITVHGFRSSFRDWAAERTAYPNHVVEMALAHVIGDKVEAAYRRGDLFTKRVRLMADWAKFCSTKPAPAHEKVVNLRKATQ